MSELRDKVVNADAYVIGAPNYYSTLNALTHAFIERWFQFRHQEGDILWGKLGVAVGVGGMDGGFPADDIEKFFLYSFIETVAKISGQGAASCYSCGYGETCEVGVPIMLYGKGVKKIARCGASSTAMGAPKRAKKKDLLARVGREIEDPQQDCTRIARRI